MRRSLFIPALIGAASLSNLFGQAPSTVTELAPGFTVGLEVTRRIRLDLYTGRERDDLDAAKWKIGAGASFRVRPLLKMLADDTDSDKWHRLVVGGFYEYSRSTESGVHTIEHKAYVEATLRWDFAGSYLLSNRVRTEFRWIEGEYRFRFRDGVMLERTLRPGRFKITPYVLAEAYWDQHYGKWNKFRFIGGSRVRLFSRTSLDLYYERSHCTTCSHPNTNSLGASVMIFFKRKK